MNEDRQLYTSRVAASVCTAFAASQAAADQLFLGGGLGVTGEVDLWVTGRASRTGESPRLFVGAGLPSVIRGGGTEQVPDTRQQLTRHALR